MIRLSFIGDVMCEHTRLESFREEGGAYNFTSLFSGVEDEFRKSDLTVANLETPLAGEELRYSYRDYQFNTPEQLGFAMKNAGIDVVSTANNHVLDRGFEGLAKTLETLDSIGLMHTGSARTEDESRPLIVDVNGLRIGILSYTYGTEACYNGCYLTPGEEYRVNLLRNQELTNPVKRYLLVSKSFVPRALRAVYRRVLPGLAKRPVGELKEKDSRQKKRLADDIAYAREKSDLVIMCLHCGGQFNDEPTKYTKETVEYCFRQGVDIVVGNHEHHIQKHELSAAGQFAAYCLGNYTSNYGIDRKPFDKNAECSALLNLYIDETSGKLKDAGLEILISVTNDDSVIVTRPICECIAEADDETRELLIEKNRKAVSAFVGKNLDKVKPEREYMISQLTGRKDQ